jgi:DNA-binding NarL/FixJ family response regulator
MSTTRTLTDTPDRPRVLLADDHRIVAEGLKSILEEEFEVVGVVEDGRALVDSMRKLRPDLVVADISMPHLNGIDAMVHLKREHPDVKVIFLTMHQEPAYARRALDAGAVGFVVKHSAPAELLTALREAVRGRTYITPALAAQVLDSMRKGGRATADPSSRLTPRQREILQLLVEGRSAKQIAGVLDISARTVEFHKYQMMESLGLHNSAELIHFGIKHDIVGV